MMNSVNLIGRLTKDAVYTAKKGEDGVAIANFSIAIDRPFKTGEAKTDFPRVTVFGKNADNVIKYSGKGLLIGVTGRIQTGSYTNKEGTTVYTTNVVAERIEFLEYKGEKTTERKTVAPAQAAPAEGAGDPVPVPSDAGGNADCFEACMDEEDF